MTQKLDREREIIQSFISLSDRLIDDFDILDLTIQLTEDCARLLDVAAAGLLLADPGGTLHLLAATSEQARSLEVFQLQREEGPCLDCYQTGKAVSVADLAEETERWPRFAASAAQEGFVSVHAIPMRLHDDVLGALGLFGSTTGSLNDDDRNLAQALAHVASVAILEQNHTVTRSTVLPGLQAAIASRGTLEMAKGVLAEMHAIEMVEASARLRSYARQHDLRLTELARAVVSGEPQPRQALLDELGELVPARLPVRR
ncbi:MAG: GAF and ANTAR domain-containing protein [Actinomycetota bacterium]|nr:GAF and ANTAR domain-containing protein [Actinomycetota bacterium]